MRKFLITLFFGWAGIHKFLDKKIGTGILYLCTFGLFGIGWIIDTIKSALPLFPRNYSSNQTRIIDVSGTYYRKDEISSILCDNPMYNLSDVDFINKIPCGKKIYKFKIKRSSALLVQEPTNPHDSNAIQVLIDNTHVGYIPSDCCSEVKSILNSIISVSSEIYGGDYKYHSNGEVFKATISFNIRLFINI